MYRGSSLLTTTAAASVLPAASSDSPTPGCVASESPASMISKRTPSPHINFSRPRIHATSSSGSGGNEEEPPLPREPRFAPYQHLSTPARLSVETFNLEPSESNKAGIISRTEAFLTRRGSFLPRTEDQRFLGLPASKRNHRKSIDSTASSDTTNRPSTGSDATTASESTTGSDATTASSRSNSVHGLPHHRKSTPLKSILKQPSVHVSSDELSVRSSGDADQSSLSSHRTTSHHGHEDGVGGAYYDQRGKWHASAFDTSHLSDKEMARLRKKGINPSLYAEMKAARTAAAGGKGKLSVATLSSLVRI